MFKKLITNKNLVNNNSRLKLFNFQKPHFQALSSFPSQQPYHNKNPHNCQCFKLIQKNNLVKYPFSFNKNKKNTLLRSALFLVSAHRSGLVPI